MFTLVTTHVSSFDVMSFVYVQSDLLSPLFCVVLYCPVWANITKMNSRRFLSLDLTWLISPVHVMYTYTHGCNANTHTHTKLTQKHICNVSLYAQNVDIHFWLHVPVKARDRPWHLPPFVSATSAHAALRSCGRGGGRVHLCLQLKHRVTATGCNMVRLYLGVSVSGRVLSFP